MFDRITAESIRSAPPLDGVDPDRLAADLTDAYVQVSVAKALLDDDMTQVDDALIEKLTSIARAQETLALVLSEPESRRAAAHVAARAYQVIALAGKPDLSSFTASSIPTKVSSMLLFIAADSTADAAEMAQNLHGIDGSLEAVLVEALGAVGRSDFRTVASLSLPAFELPDASSPHVVAAYVGYFECLHRLVEMCQALLRVDRLEWSPGMFITIADRMQGTFGVDIDGGIVNADDTIAGPWHLASLLSLTEKIFMESALTGIPAPEQVGERDWTELVERLARRRPTLWRNHRNAVSSGFLEPGTSAVVTFPTGAGKSTVTELKVAATTLAGRNAIFLVPTLSLLDQQAAALRSTLSGVEIIAQRDIDDLNDFEPRYGTSVFVMTPESCLAWFSANPERFGSVGLVAFDEAHLLSAKGDPPSRRSLDATLCLLLLCRRFPLADVFLVSAMIGNAEPLRDWLADLTGRTAVALNDPWKPTRQARGAVVYRAQDLHRLDAMIEEAAREGTTDGPPAHLRNRAVATPFGFFGLLPTWESTRSQDYRWLPLLEEPAPLSVTGSRSRGGWRLSSNQNRVAGAIAKAGARTGRKVLVFSQQVKWAVSTANDVNSGSERRTPLRASERLLLSHIIEAAGSAEALYGKFENETHVLGDALPHHGLLLREERRLHESLYKRADGVPVLVATSTLAQGMNFPSEIVVIAGDRRFDADTSRMERLEAQELLNAAGRAGRAGMRSNGLVIIVPSYPVVYDGQRQMGPGWFQLQTAFSQSDQCVEVVDPIIGLLLGDQFDAGSGELDYLTRRLASSDDEEDSRDLVLRSFGAFQARRSGATQEIVRRLEIVSLTLGDDQPAWVRISVASTGLAPDDVEFIGAALSAAPQGESLVEWIAWFADVLRQRPSILEATLRAGSRAIFAGAPQELGAELEGLRGPRLAHSVNLFLDAWLEGANLMEIQQIAENIQVARPSQKCEFARKFVLRVVPDLAYLFGLPWLVAGTLGVQDELAPSASRLASAVELGVNSIAKLDYLQESPFHTRIGAHRDAR